MFCLRLCGGDEQGVNQILTDGTYLVMEQTDPTLTGAAGAQRTSPQTVGVIKMINMFVLYSCFAVFGKKHFYKF
jgi:hypothetical protein